MTYLFDKKDGTWEVRVPVPQDCRERIGKGTLTKRLGRKTKTEANELAVSVVAEFKSLIRQARGEPAPLPILNHWLAGPMTITVPAHMASQLDLPAAAPAAPPPATSSPAPSPKGKTVEDLITAYQEDKSPGWSESSKKATASVFRVLRDVFPGREISSITREEARALVGMLEGLPTNLGKRKALKGLTVPEAVEKGRELGLPCIKPKTINDGYLLHIASMWNWSKQETWLDATPFSGLSVHDPVADEDRRDAFTKAQLKALFRQEPWSRPWANDREGPGMFWCPLLCLFHGLRLGEAAALRVLDVTETDGVHLLHVLPFMGRALKTKGARGTLPLHPEVIRLGFPAYVKHRMDAAEPMLFPEGTTRAGDQVARALGRDFVSHVRGLGFIGTKLGIHSFRHNFEDALREAELVERTALALARRMEAGSSRIYGDGLSARLKAEAMAKITYLGLDLSHLRPGEEKAG